MLFEYIYYITFRTIFFPVSGIIYTLLLPLNSPHTCLRSLARCRQLLVLAPLKCLHCVVFVSRERRIGASIVLITYQLPELLSGLAAVCLCLRHLCI